MAKSLVNDVSVMTSACVDSDDDDKQSAITAINSACGLNVMARQLGRR